MDDAKLWSVIDAINNSPLKADYIEYGALKALIGVINAVPTPANNADIYGAIMVCEAVTAALGDLPFKAAGSEARALLATHIDQTRSLVAASIGGQRGDTATMKKELLARWDEFRRAFGQLEQRLFPVAVQ